MSDLTVFIEHALYDPGFVRSIPTRRRMFQLGPPDFLYSAYRPDLAAFGAVDSRPASGLPQDNDDPLSRRDVGLEFLDVTSQVNLVHVDSHRRSGRRRADIVKVTNTSSSAVDTHLLVVVRGLGDGIRLENASGITSGGDPYLRVFLPDGVLLPGHSIVRRLLFRRESHAPPVSYTLMFLSGQGTP